MMKLKSLYIVIAALSVFLLMATLWNLSENSRPIHTKIDNAIKKYDAGFSRIITIQFHNNNLFVFYETSHNTMKIVLVESNALGSMKVEALLGEMPLYSEREVSWYGISNAAPGDTELLYGIISDPTISQLFIESEDGQTVHIIKIDEETAVWFRFLNKDLSTPVIITGTDRNGEEKYYYGPYRE